MSGTTERAVCVSCGLIALAAEMVSTSEDGYEYACQGCAVQLRRHEH